MHSTLRRPLIVFLGLVLAVSAYGAQITFSPGGQPSRRPINEPPKPKAIHGLVEDQQGRPLAGARLFLKDTKSNLTRTATTDAEGLYSFANLPSDVTYDLTVDFKGISEKTSVSGLLNRTDNLVDFRLKITGTGVDTAKADGPSFRTYDGFELRASFDLPTGVPAPIPAVLLLHGFGENRAVFDGLKKHLLTRGWAVMALDLRGHGASQIRNGSQVAANLTWRTSPHDFPQDLDPALNWLKSHPRINTEKIVVIGYDVGANLALIASGKFRQVRTVVAVQPSMEESLLMAGSAQDFQPRSALIIGPTLADGALSMNPAAKQPWRFLETAPAKGAAAAFESTKTLEAVYTWLKETY